MLDNLVFREQEDIFFSILRSIVWGTAADVPSGVDWKAVLNLAARQKCLHAFSVWARANHITTPFDKQLQLTIFTLLGRHARLNNLAVEVIKLLTEHNIPATLIKGYSIAALYPDPDTREFGDVDIYVGEEHYHRAAQIVTEAYPDAHWHSDIRGGIHYILVLDKSLDRVVELHRVTMEFHHPVADQLYQNFTHKYLDSCSTSIDVQGRAVCVPPPAYNALYVFMHAWHHFESTGVGFRQLGDWALCLNYAHQQLSEQAWKEFCLEIDTLLTALNMKTVWQTFGHILVEQLQLSKSAFPLYSTRYAKRAQRLLVQLLRDGHGGRPAECRVKEMRLMRCFPYERPQNGRVKQKLFTAIRMFFETYQMAKFFPKFALCELINGIIYSGNKH